MSSYPYTSHPLRDDPDADGLIEELAENLATIAAGHGRADIAREIRTAIYHLNHPVDDLSSAEKTVDCLKPCACCAGAGAGK